MTHFFWFSFAFLGSDDRSSRIRGWFGNLQRRGCSWWSPNIRHCTWILRVVGNQTSRPVDSRCMLIGIVPIWHGFVRSLRLFVDGTPCCAFVRFLISPWCLSIGLRWIVSPCRYWYRVVVRVAWLSPSWGDWRSAVRPGPFSMVWNGSMWSANRWSPVWCYILLISAGPWWSP